MHFHVMAKPCGASCNLRCTYCFYTEKENLYGGPAQFRMPPAVLESFIRQYIACQDTPEVQFAWQGGEPTLLGINYFESVVALQEKYAGGKKVFNSIQTNGTRLTDAWCRFFKEHGFLVGLSIDGPRELHDRYRRKANGQPTFDIVLSGVELLRKHQVPFNTLTVVNDRNARRPLDVYRFLKKVGDGHMQFIPAVACLPDGAAKSLGLNLAIPPLLGDKTKKSRLTPWSVSPKGLASFYISIFDAWVRQDVGRVFVQFFDVALGNWIGAGSALCQFSAVCGMAVALEHNGDLFSCDHYVYPEYKLGNIMETPLPKLMASPRQQRFGKAKLENLPTYCKICEVRPACHGDCPKHRFADTPDGEPGLSYLCEGYKKIFKHMAPYLSIMADLVKAGRPAPDIMKILRQQQLETPGSRPGRNAPCPCGSGKKYKRCCGP
jgi:uncharacterized protein